MSSTLTWRPTYSSGNNLPDELKHILNNRFDGIDGQILNSVDLDYLSGLKDAGVKGVEKLIKAIKKHEIITLNLEY